jgi:hypothetical protein
MGGAGFGVDLDGREIRYVVREMVIGGEGGLLMVVAGGERVVGCCCCTADCCSYCEVWLFFSLLGSVVFFVAFMAFVFVWVSAFFFRPVVLALWLVGWFVGSGLVVGRMRSCPVPVRDGLLSGLDVTVETGLGNDSEDITVGGCSGLAGRPSRCEVLNTGWSRGVEVFTRFFSLTWGLEAGPRQVNKKPSGSASLVETEKGVGLDF